MKCKPHSSTHTYTITHWFSAASFPGLEHCLTGSNLYLTAFADFLKLALLPPHYENLHNPFYFNAVFQILPTSIPICSILLSFQTCCIPRHESWLETLWDTWPELEKKRTRHTLMWHTRSLWFPLWKCIHFNITVRGRHSYSSVCSQWLKLGLTHSRWWGDFVSNKIWFT